VRVVDRWLLKAADTAASVRGNNAERWPFILDKHVGTIERYGSGSCNSHAMPGSMICDHRSLVLRGPTALPATPVGFTAAAGAAVRGLGIPGASRWADYLGILRITTMRHYPPSL